MRPVASSLVPTPQNKMNGRGGAQAKFYADVAFLIPEIPIGHSCDRSQQLVVCAKVADSRKHPECTDLSLSILKLMEIAPPRRKEENCQFLDLPLC